MRSLARIFTFPSNIIVERLLRTLKTGYTSPEGPTGVTPRHHRNAVLILKMIGRPALPVLLKWLTSNLYIDGAYEVLHSIGQPAADACMPWLSLDHRQYQRQHAANFLSEYGETAAIEPLINLLQNDPVHQVRDCAARGLGRFVQIPVVVPPLITALQQDGHINVRISAARALGQIGGPDACEGLLAALSTQEFEVQVIVAEQVAQFRDERALEPMLTVLAACSEKVRRRKSKYLYPTKTVITALGMLGDVRAIEPIITTVRQVYSVLKEAGERKLIFDAGNSALLALGASPIFDEAWLAAHLEEATDQLDASRKAID